MLQDVNEEKIIALRTKAKQARAAFVEAARMLTLEQMQEMSKESVLLLAELGLLDTATKNG